MITIKLVGGLGNQMFQYVAAKSLAKLHRTKLCLDLSWFKNIPDKATTRKFELACFKLSKQIPHLTSPSREGIEQFLDKFKFWNKKKFYQEPHYHFDSKFFDLGSDVVLNGYFQSEKYFKNIEKIIRKEFTFKHKKKGRNKELAELIKKTNSVSLHIRRGDYVSDAKTDQTHGTCNLDYYHRCITKIKKEVEDPHYFIFSDDINWVKENLKINHPAEYVDWNTGEKSYEDMRLMIQCKHNIIANSSFSWWGAWLNDNPNKIVFAPQKWFLDDSKNTKDVIPEIWRKI